MRTDDPTYTRADDRVNESESEVATLGPAAAATPNGASSLLPLAPLIGVVTFLGLWQFLVWAFDVKRFVLPGPWSIVRHIASEPGFYFRNARITMWAALLGFTIAFVAAMVAATLMARSKVLERAGLPISVLIQVTPVIAYAPAIVIWLGPGLPSILTITALVCFVPFLINAIAGLRSVDPLLLELARSVNAGEVEVLRRLRIPSALPYLLSAAKINVGLALIGAVLGEYFALTTRGLGHAVKTAQSRNLIDQQWGAIFTLAILGSLATLLITGLERIALRGHAAQRQ
jgi:NitT/TauT family transport system permease protein